MVKMKISIDKSEAKVFLFVIISLAILIEPNYFSQYKESEIVVRIDLLYDVFKVVISLLIITVYIFYFKYIRQSVLIMFFVVQSLLLVSTILNGLTIVNWFRDFRISAIVVMLINLTICMGYSRQIIRSISVLFGIYGYISLITFILYPNGLYTHELGYRNCWFLGYKNIAVPILVIGIVFAVYYSIESFGKLTLFALSVIFTSEVYIFLVFSATGMIISILCLGLLILNNMIPNVLNLIDARRILFMNFLIFPFLVVFRVQDYISLLSMFVESFGKTLTFSGRTGLWDYAISLFNDNWLIGIGVRDGRFYALSSGRWWAIHLHSFYLQTLVEGGLITFTSFFFMLLYVCKKFDIGVTYYSSNIFKIGFFCFLIAFQFETYAQASVFYTILIVMSNIDLVEEDFRWMQCAIKENVDMLITIK